MRVGVHWKLALTFCLAVTLGLGAGYAYLTDHLKAYVENNLQDRLKKELFLGKSLVESLLGRGVTPTGADAAADEIGRLLGVRATLITRDGSVIGDSELDAGKLAGIENHLGRPEVRDALERGFGMRRHYSRTLKREFLYQAVPFTGDRASGVLRLAVPLSEIDLLESHLRRMILAALLLVFVLSFGFALAVSRVVSKPLEQMADVARSVAGGDFARKPVASSRDEIGDLAAALGFMTDGIRERIETIRQEAAKMDAVVSGMSEGVLVVDARGAVTLLNTAARVLFMTDAPEAGKMPVEIVRSAVIQGIVDRILKDRRHFVSEEVVLSSPEEKILRVNGAPILRDGELDGAVLVFHDITPLCHAERIRRDFVANVSHELRTPVTSIKGYAETLLDAGCRDAKTTKEFVGIIHESSARLEALIHDLLDLSRIESGRMEMELERTDLGLLAHRAAGILAKSADSRSIRVAVDIPEGAFAVTADPARLSQVFVNLLDNALKYTPLGGTVRVNAEALGDRVRVEVADTGIGIPAGDLPRIFERFYRVDKARSRELGGTGLGLSIVKHIVQAHGGEVSVRSDPGRGSTFGFTIPIA